jgi:hypothetical protein
MMEPHHLARIAYFALLQRVADAQAKIIEIEALIARFGDDALPSESALRSIGALSRASDSMRTRLRSNQDRIEEALPTIRFLERVFAEQSERDLEALATYFRSQR